MLTFCIVHPGAFSPEQFADPHYGRFARSFLRNVSSNSVLLIDHQGFLLDEIESNVSGIPIKHRQEIEIQIEEIRKSLRSKKARRLAVKCCPQKCPVSRNQTSNRQCSVLSKNARADAVICGTGDRPSVESEVNNQLIIELPNLEDSKVESNRRGWMEQLPPIDQLADGEFDDLIVRATCYSTWLRIYDKQIGKGTNASNFRRGIERILKLWVDNCHFAPQLVEIITTEGERLMPGDGNFEVERKQELIKAAIGKIQDRIMRPLGGSFAVELKLAVKQDLSNMYHARHLQSQMANIMFERGFDFLNNDGSFKRAFIQIANAAQDHLQEFRSAPDSILVTEP